MKQLIIGFSLLFSLTANAQNILCFKGDPSGKGALTMGIVDITPPSASHINTPNNSGILLKIINQYLISDGIKKIGSN